MVTIVGYRESQTESGEKFLSLIIQGELETVYSEKTKKPYFTARKTSIPCTFDERYANNLIGKEIPGEIQRVPCKAYDYEIPSTGEKIKLEHTYQYSPEPATMEETVLG